MADKRRRKSLRQVFRRPETPPATPSLPSAPPSPIDSRRVDSFPTTSPNESENSSPKIRPRTLQKTNRISVFGSLRSLHSLDEDEKATLTRSDSKASSLHDDVCSPSRGLYGETVVRFGEVQMAGNNMFRKRNHYMVLTELHLIRFKTQAKAAEIFPMLSPALTRQPVTRTSLASVGSFNEMQMSAYSEATQSLALDQVVAVYRLDDGRPYFTVEVSCLDESASRVSAMQMQFNEPREAEAWTSAISTAAMEARNLLGYSFRDRTLDYVARHLESQRDYDPQHFQLFKAVRLSALKSSSKSSSDDLAKHNTSVCYFAIGINKIHFIPVPKTSQRSSATSLNEFENITSLGMVTLTSIKLLPGEDVFQLHFKTPLGQTHNMLLASYHASEIVLWIRFASEYLRPEWTIQPFIFDVPSELEDKMDPPAFAAEEYNCFDRTLIAYCAAYNLNTARLTYTVDFECEDAPCFCLLPPVDRSGYNALELLAVFRALRYNEFFSSISFANINLRPLRELYDLVLSDMDSASTRSGVPVGITNHDTMSVLTHEVRALALKSRRLRRFDFTNAMSKSTRTDDGRQACSIPEALAPLTKRSLTNVDWIILNGIQLGDSDLDYLVDAASERRGHFRALEVGECGLSVQDVDVLLSTLAIHDATVEVINISAAQGRFSPELFQRGIGAFRRIRRLNLSRVQKTAGLEPLIAPEILLGWRLEALHLSQTTLNEQMIDGISAYLVSEQSDSLRELHINQCGLTGKDLAVFLQAMTRRRGVARIMHVNASDNRLGTGSSALSQCIAQSYGPTSLSMRMMDFGKETHFRELIEAVGKNTTLRSLDISRASLPYDASEETCEALKEMFALNDTLEELDLSGEHAHLDAARFGIGLNIALRGLEGNTSLKMLRIEYQGLGLQGANTLAGVLETNKSLLEIHCEHNDINLQSFTVLVNALRHNKTLLYMPTLQSDKNKSMETVRHEFDAADRVGSHHIKGSPKPHTLRKGMNALAHKSSRHSHHRKNSSMASNISFTEQDVAATMIALEERWQVQQERMQQYLTRNYQLASGMLSIGEENEEKDGSRFSDENDRRPSTADSLGRILARVKLDRTPTIERTSLLGSFDERIGGERQPVIFHMSEEDDVDG